MLDTAFQKDVSSGSFSAPLLLGICFFLFSLYQSVVVVVVLLFTFAKGKVGAAYREKRGVHIGILSLFPFLLNCTNTKNSRDWDGGVKQERKRNGS